TGVGQGPARMRPTSGTVRRFLAGNETAPRRDTGGDWSTFAAAAANGRHPPRRVGDRSAGASRNPGGPDASASVGRTGGDERLEAEAREAREAIERIGAGK